MKDRNDRKTHQSIANFSHLCLFSIRKICEAAKKFENVFEKIKKCRKSKSVFFLKASKEISWHNSL